MRNRFADSLGELLRRVPALFRAEKERQGCEWGGGWVVSSSACGPASRSDALCPLTRSLTHLTTMGRALWSLPSVDRNPEVRSQAGCSFLVASTRGLKPTHYSQGLLAFALMPTECHTSPFKPRCLGRMEAILPTGRRTSRVILSTEDWPEQGDLHENGADRPVCDNKRDSASVSGPGLGQRASMLISESWTHCSHPCWTGRETRVGQFKAAWLRLHGW